MRYLLVQYGMTIARVSWKPDARCQLVWLKNTRYSIWRPDLAHVQYLYSTIPYPPVRVPTRAAYVKCNLSRYAIQNAGLIQNDIVNLDNGQCNTQSDA